MYKLRLGKCTDIHTTPLIKFILIYKYIKNNDYCVENKSIFNNNNLGERNIAVLM